MNPPSDVATFLASAGLSLTLGTNLFVGLPRDVSSAVPKNAVFVFGIPGGGVERTMGEVTELRSPHVNVRVRWTSFSSGDTKTRAVQEALQAPSISGYLDIAAMQSEPLVLGQDQEGLHMWSLMYEMVYEDAT